MNKLTTEEFNSIKELEESKRLIDLEYGVIGKITCELNERISNLDIYVKELNSKENNLLKTLSDKYGEASIDTKTGEISYIKSNKNETE